LVPWSRRSTAGIRLHASSIPDDGFARGAVIDSLDLRLRWYEGRHPNLESLTFVGIRLLTPRNALFQPLSWQLQAGLECFREDGRDLGDLVLGLAGGAGPSWALGEDALVYDLPTAPKHDCPSRAEHEDGSPQKKIATQADARCSNPITKDPARIGMGRRKGLGLFIFQ
jgi:hypothetical protein